MVHSCIRVVTYNYKMVISIVPVLHIYFILYKCVKSIFKVIVSEKRVNICSSVSSAP